MRLINRKVDGGGSLILGALPFILLLIVYVVTSDARLDANANDKLLPSLANIADAVDRLAFQPDKRKVNTRFGLIRSPASAGLLPGYR